MTIYTNLFTPSAAPQHFLYFFPLPQWHGSFLPIFIAACWMGGDSFLSKSDKFSSLSGSTPRIKCQPLSWQMLAIASILDSSATRNINGFFLLPRLATAAYLPPVVVTLIA